MVCMLFLLYQTSNVLGKKISQYFISKYYIYETNSRYYQTGIPKYHRFLNNITKKAIHCKAQKE